jgi:hypothetical protein
VRHYVRDAQSGSYFKQEDVWVRDISDAHEFRTEAESVRFLKHHPGRDLEIVLRC